MIFTCSGRHGSRLHRLPERGDPDAAAAHLVLPLLHHAHHPRPGLPVHHGEAPHDDGDGDDGDGDD